MTVIRTSRKLGFEGYTELQNFLKASIYDEIERNNGINFLSTKEKVGAKLPGLRADNLYEQMLENISINIQDIFVKNSMDAFDQASDIIWSSHKKFVIGFRGCSGVAQTIGGSLSDVFSNVRTILTADSGAIEALLDIDSNDCLIIISYPRYSEMAKIAIDIARSKGAKIIALTDRVTSPINSFSNVSLLSGVDSITINNSYIAPMVVAEMLLATVYRNIGSEEEDRLKRLEQYISRSGLY